MNPPSRTRIKICGLTREQDVDCAVAAGADAVGFVLYAPSPRFVDAARAAELARRLPPFVTPVLLFVNASLDAIAAACQAVPGATLQFHGDETPQFCAEVARQLHRPFLRAARIPTVGKGSFNLLEFASFYSQAQALLLDAHVEGYGGGGKSFDWSLVPPAMPLPLVLSGGLHPGNVARAMTSLRPWAVDVSSGVETAPGIKDAEMMVRFIAEVRMADA